jgi:hypothetical protein
MQNCFCQFKLIDLVKIKRSKPVCLTKCMDKSQSRPVHGLDTDKFVDGLQPWTVRGLLCKR